MKRLNSYSIRDAPKKTWKNSGKKFRTSGKTILHNQFIKDGNAALWMSFFPW